MSVIILLSKSITLDSYYFCFRAQQFRAMDDKEVPTFKIFKFNKDTTFKTGEGVCGKCKEKIYPKSFTYNRCKLALQLPM